MAVTVTRIPDPTTDDLDGIVEQLRATWTATVTVRRQSKQDVGYRDIYVSLDGEPLAQLKAGEEVSKEISPGPHQLRAHNTLFRKSVDFTVRVGEHASFMTINRAGFGTYSVLAFFFGGGPLYLTLEYEGLRRDAS